MPSAPSTGGTGTVTVTTNRDCTWSASSTASWIAITSGATGQGDGSFTYRIAENTDPASRRGTLTVNDSQLAIAQDPAPCTYAVAPLSTTVGPSGGSVTIRVDARAGCAWTTASQASWIQVASGANGNGGGSVTISVAANPGSDSRTGTVTIAGQSVTVVQSEINCAATLTPSSVNASAQASTIAIAVAIGPTCRWTAASGADWISVTSGAAGTGPGQVQLSLAANAGTSTRQSVVTIGGSPLAVVQSGTTPCVYAISPTSAPAPAAGGTGSFSLTTSSGCGWAVGSNASWISITSAPTGSGNATIAYTAAPNAGAARTGTITVGGQTFTVNQAATACSFSLSPTSQNVAAAGGTGTVSVTTGAACAWTATSDSSWLTLGRSSGTGSGSVSFTVASNSGAARNGTITIGGQTFTVQQAAAVATCSFAISPQTQTFRSAGGTGSIAVTTGAACTWAATADVSWITLTGAKAGTGNGTVPFSVAAFGGTGSRIGTVTIADQTFTVTQNDK